MHSPVCWLLRSARRESILVTAVLAFSIAVIASPKFPSFRLSSRLALRAVAPLVILFHHEENQPVTVTPGDFNGDGKVDLLVGTLWNNEYSNELTLFPGRGDGTFGTATVTKLNARPQAAQSADFNGDGISDIALVTSPQSPGEEGRVWIFLGTKNGPLKSSYSSVLPETPHAVFVADFDNDGKLDVAVSAWSSRFWIFHGRGDGTLEAPVLACRCDVSLVADFNGDGKPDLVSRDGVYAVVRMNRGDGTFTQTMTFDGRGLGAPVEFRESVSTADLNGDGIPDLVFANRRAHGLSVYLGNGDGTFRAADSLAAPEVHAIQIADLNADGFPDILAAVWQRNRGELLIFPGHGKGVFGNPIPMRVGYSPSAIGIADFNLDHKLDFAVGSLGDQSVSVFLQSR
jgi:hypothetical protein